MQTSTLKEQLAAERMAKKIQAELKTALRDIPENCRGLYFSRILTPFASDSVSQKMERAFAETWAQHNDEKERIPISSELLFPRESEFEDIDEDQRRFIPGNSWDLAVGEALLSTFAQWLGTADGAQFIQEAFRRAGGRIYMSLPMPDNPLPELIAPRK